MTKQEFGSYLRQVRERAGLSVENACGYDCEPRTLYDAERGASIPRQEILREVLERYQGQGSLNEESAELLGRIAEDLRQEQRDKRTEERAQKKEADRREREDAARVIANRMEEICRFLRYSNIESALTVLSEIHKNMQTDALNTDGDYLYESVWTAVHLAIAIQEGYGVFDMEFRGRPILEHLRFQIRQRWPLFDGTSVPGENDSPALGTDLDPFPFRRADFILFNCFSLCLFHSGATAEAMVLQNQIYERIRKKEQHAVGEFLAGAISCHNLACMFYQIGKEREARQYLKRAQRQLSYCGDTAIHFHTARLNSRLSEKEKKKKDSDRSGGEEELRGIFHTFPEDCRPKKRFEDFRRMPLEIWIC